MLCVVTFANVNSK